jgi:choline dehydrogenase-like flavoprotein
MILDFAIDGRDPLSRTFDVCVVGSGPAGITLARRLAGRGLDVALMEAGGLDPDPRSQALYEGELAGLPYYPLDAARLRFFGGTSGHWAGWCRALRPPDFETRPGVPMSGWPISAADLAPYRDEADRILDLGPAPEDPAPDPDGIFQEFDFRFSTPPTRFGPKYQAEIGGTDNLLLALNANLVDIRLTDDLGRVAHLVFRSYAPGDPGTRLSARACVLCLGGLENARALLAADRQMPQGVGNGHDLVGRFFCEHPGFRVADVLFEQPAPPIPAGSTAVNPDHRFFRPTDAFLRRNALPGFFWLLLRDEVLRLPASLPKRLAHDAACGIPFAERLAEEVLGREVKCPGDRGTLTGQLILTSEQMLDRDSRVALAPERDALGQRRIVLDWRLAERDLAWIHDATATFGGFLADRGIGRLRLHEWLAEKSWGVLGTYAPEGSYHHMCTTRMSPDPRTGVVDRDCRVHGIANLYLAGSSVFATPGWANPTYTVVQMALRLGDHLAGELKR